MFKRSLFIIIALLLCSVAFAEWEAYSDFITIAESNATGSGNNNRGTADGRGDQGFLSSNTSIVRAASFLSGSTPVATNCYGYIFDKTNGSNTGYSEMLAYSGVGDVNTITDSLSWYNYTFPSGADGTLLYQGINYTFVVNCSGIDNFVWRMDIPAIYEDVPYWHKGEIGGASSTEYPNENGVFKIWGEPLNVDNCSNNTVKVLNISFLHTSNLSNAYVNATVEFSGYHTSFYDSYKFVSDLYFCANHPDYRDLSLIFVNYYLGNSNYQYYDFISLGANYTNLTLYVQDSQETFIFRIRDFDSSSLLSSVTSEMYIRLGNEWVLIDSKETDITGIAQFNYLKNTEYRFSFSSSGYETLDFTINPIIQDVYNIKMQRAALVNETQDFDRLAISYTTQVYKNNENNNFSFLIISPYYELLSYGFNLTFPGGYSNKSGTSSVGEFLTTNFTIAGATLGDRVKLDYFYNTQVSGLRSFTYYFPIAYNDTNGTFIGVRENTYGLSLFERLLISVLGVLMVVGIGTLAGQPLPSFGLGMFVYGFLVYIGFIPLWSVLIPMFLAVLILGASSQI